MQIDRFVVENRQGSYIYKACQQEEQSNEEQLNSLVLHFIPL